MVENIHWGLDNPHPLMIHILKAILLAKILKVAFTGWITLPLLVTAKQGLQCVSEIGL